MANSVEEAVQALLLADNDAYDTPTSLAALGLSRFPADDGDLAVFVQSPVPGEAQRPYCAVSAPMSANGFDTKTRIGAEWMLDIGVYCDNTGSLTQINALADRIFRLLRYTGQSALEIDGFSVVLCRVNWPIVAPTDETLVGRIIMLQVTATANEEI